MTNKPLHIVFLDFDDFRNPLLGAGQAWATYEVGKRLAKKGHFVTSLCSKYPNYKDRTEDGITYKHIGLGTSNIRLNNIFYFLFIPFMLPFVKADIIVECFTAPISTLFSPLFTKIPIVALPSMFDAAHFSRIYHLPLTIIEKFGVRFYKYFLPYTEQIDRKMKSMNPTIISKIVPEGVNSEFLQIKRKNPKHILFIGRYDMSQKGIDLMLKAYAKIHDKIGYPLLIAGRGPDEKNIRSLIKELKISDKAKVIGPAYGEEKNKLLSEALSVMFPSRTETFSLFALEAIAAGVPVVAFDIPGISWMDKKISLKAEAFNIDQYAELIMRTKNPELNKKLSVEGREFVKKYTWEKVADEFESFFYQILNSEKKYEKK